VLLSTVLEKVVMVLVVVVVGTGCSYTSERHTCQRHFLYMASVSLSLSLVPLFFFLFYRVGSSLMSFFASDIFEEKIMRYKVRTLACLPVVVNLSNAC